MTAPDTGVAVAAPARASTATTTSTNREPGAASLASSRRRSRIGRYLAGHAWAHLLLLSGIAIFLFPFVYMLATSLKTDEELTGTDWFPTLPQFQPASPCVRATPAVAKPLEASEEKWAAVLPALRRITREAVDAAPLPVGAADVDANAYRAAATEFLLAATVPRLNLDLWSTPTAGTPGAAASVGNSSAAPPGDTSKLEAAYKAAITPVAVADALDNRLARL